MSRGDIAPELHRDNKFGKINHCWRSFVWRNSTFLSCAGSTSSSHKPKDAHVTTRYAARRGRFFRSPR
jgi:hypothetical protein